MKTTKNLIAILLALLLVLSLSTTAFAADGGTITIMNPEVNATYTVYKLLDGQVEGDAVTYTVAKTGTDMLALLNAEGSPFELIESGDVYYVVQKTGTDASTVRKWLQDNASALITAAGTGTSQTADATAQPVEFTGLPYGYYLIHSSTISATLVIVDTNNTDIEVYDKNPRKPGPLVKNTDEVSVAVGDEVQYTLSFKATNFVTPEVQAMLPPVPFISVKDTNFVTPEVPEKFYDTDAGNPSKIILDYYLTDTYTGLALKQIDKIEYTYVGADKPVALADTAYSAKNVDGVTTILIPWAQLENGKYVSLYPDKCTVTVTYTMTVLESAITNGYNAPNTAYLDYLPVAPTPPADDPIDPSEPGDPFDPKKPFDPEKPDGPNPENPKTPWEYNSKDDEIVYTCGINIDKVDENGQKLSGAQFVLYRLSGETKEYYKWDDNKVTWVAYENADKKTADNVKAAVAEVEFSGLDVGTYYLSEVVAPKGYNLPKTPFKVEIGCTGTKAAKNVAFTAKVDDTAVFVINVPASASLASVADVKIVNTPGQELPGTGGAGTIAMIAAGSFVAIMTAVLLITKKRVYNKGF